MRPIWKITEEILTDWQNVSPHAQPYLNAMLYLDDFTSQYGLDDGESVVLYFLSNATTWRGETARRIKAELRKDLKEYRRRI